MAAVRKLAETPDAFDPALWRKCAEQGWTGIIFPEQYGGVGLGLVEMAAEKLNTPADQLIRTVLKLLA